MLKYCILFVVYIKLVFGCWGANPDLYRDTGFPADINWNFSEDNDGYGGYSAYFEQAAVYDEYTKYGAGGQNLTIDEAAENALLPNGVQSQDSLKSIFSDKWKKWMQEYYKKKALEEEESGTLTSEERKEQNDPFWPQQLIGYGKGSSGDPAPPYAYRPNKDEGFPALCYQPIHKGRYVGIKCDPGPRYAFVAEIKICVAFYFRGCGENQNNFKTKQNCEDICTKIPMAGCNPNTMQEIDRIGFEYGLV